MVLPWNYVDWALDRARDGWPSHKIGRTALYKARRDKPHRREWRQLARQIAADRRLRAVLDMAANTYALERRRAAK